MKKIVANMTMGSDMSPLFADVIHSMSTPDIVIKKMTYLYLINYGRSRPDLIHHAISHFLTDCADRNPLVRSLSLRTMSYIPLPIVTSSLLDPLRHCLSDADPYVRKTAAICVAKVWFYDRAIVEKEGLISNLRDLLADSNASVIANAVASLTEITDKSDTITLKLNLTIANKLLSAVGECSEWGQIYILESLLHFVPESSDEAQVLCERISSRLQHSNSAVVLTSTKIIIYLLNYINDQNVIDHYCKKLSPPLITLLSSGPEVQYVALRNILLIIQRRPLVLRNDVRVFFVKYLDPIYVKLAKLEIIYRLTREDNCNEILAELTEYATEIDVDFVRKAVRSIGRLAIKIDGAADRCVKALLELIETKVTYVVQEAIVVFKDVFRRYPHRYDIVIPTLTANLDSLDEPEAKASMIWIIGECAERIENSHELLDDFLFNFLDEPVEVQLALLTATVKLFIKTPQQGQELVPKVLKWATEDIDNPDLRDRGFVYWRLLSSDPTAAREIVLGDKPIISTDADKMDRSLLDSLLLHIGSLSSIYHKQPTAFIRGSKVKYLQDSPALDSYSRRAAALASARNTQPAPLPTMPDVVDKAMRPVSVAGNLPHIPDQATNRMTMDMNKMSIESPVMFSPTSPVINNNSPSNNSPSMFSSTYGTGQYSQIINEEQSRVTSPESGTTPIMDQSNPYAALGEAFGDDNLTTVAGESDTQLNQFLI